jgi:hypothetical protein
MPPPKWSDSVADKYSNDGSEPVYTPPGSNEHMSSPSNDLGAELTQLMGTMAQLSNKFGLNDHAPRAQVSPEKAAEYAAAIKNTIDTFEAALNGLQFSSPGTEKFRAYLEHHLERMLDRYDMAILDNVVPSQYLNHNSGILSGSDYRPSAIRSRETQINDSTSTLPDKPPACDNNNDRSAKTFTQVQIEPRSNEELMNADFNSLNLDDKARVLLPLLMGTHDAPVEHLQSSASNLKEATLPGNQFRIRRGTSSIAQNRMQKEEDNGRSTTKALNDVIRRISERAVGKMPKPSEFILAGDPSNRFTPMYGRSIDAVTGRDPDGIAKTFENAFPKLSTFGQLCKQMRDQCNIDQNVSDKQPPSLDSSLSNNDQDMSDWIEGLLRDEDNEVYIGDPSFSPWQSHKEGVHWSGQGHCTSGNSSTSLGSNSFSPATRSDPSQPVDGKGIKVAHAQYELHSPHLAKVPRPHEDNVADTDNWNQFYMSFLEQSAAFFAKGKQPPFKSQSLDFIKKLITEKSEQVSTVEDKTSKPTTSEGIAGLYQKVAELNTDVPHSSNDGMVREPTDPGKDKHVSDDMMEKRYYDLSDEGVGTPASSCDGSVTERSSSWSAQETTGSDHGGGSDNGNAKEPFLRCDSCGSSNVSVLLGGLDCMNCGILTECPAPNHVVSREQVDGGNEVKHVAPVQAAAPPTALHNIIRAPGLRSMASVDATAVPDAADDGWGAPPKVDTVDVAGWGVPSKAEADAWGAPSTVEFGIMPGLVAGRNSTSSSVTNEDHVWTKTRDNHLLDLKARFPNRSWAKIADGIGLPVFMCKERFEVIKPTQPKPKLTKKQKKQLKKQQSSEVEVSGAFAGTAKQNTGSKSDVMNAASPIQSGIFDNIKSNSDTVLESVNGAAIGREDCWGGTANANDHPGWGGDSWAQTIRGDAVSVGDGISEANHDDWRPSRLWTSVPPTPRISSTNSEPADPAPKNYMVTYWATVECDDQMIHIPINNNNISGPEKTVLDGPAKKVWKWVQDKGLGDKVGLQDALDLAQDVHGDDEKDASAPCTLPKPSCPPSLRQSLSPSSTREYEGCCGICGEFGWCDCGAH